MALTVEKYKWQPNFKDETWIIDKRNQTEFQVTLKQGEDVEIEFTWDYGYGGNGCESMYIPVNLLKELIADLNL